jgi:hypothetical protein
MITEDEAALAIEWLRWYCLDEGLGDLPHDEEAYGNGHIVDWSQLPPGSEALYEKLHKVAA